MLSAVIPSIHSYSALQLALQQIHQRYVQSGPLVLGSALLNFPNGADEDAVATAVSVKILTDKKVYNRLIAE